MYVCVHTVYINVCILRALRGVAGGDGELGCLCGKAGTSHLCDGSAHSSGCVVNGYGCLLSYYYHAPGLLQLYALKTASVDLQQSLQEMV